jgi:hypothetical protein
LENWASYYDYDYDYDYYYLSAAENWGRAVLNIYWAPALRRPKNIIESVLGHWRCHPCRLHLGKHERSHPSKRRTLESSTARWIAIQMAV